MQPKPDGKPARTERVTFTKDAASRIAKVVRKVEAGNRDAAPLVFDKVLAASAGPTMRIGKTSSTWNKGTLANISIYEDGNPPDETTSNVAIANVVNHWGNVGANKWVGIMKARNGQWYLVVSEC